VAGPVWRPPTSYVHGVSGPCVVVPGRVASWLNGHAGLTALRISIRGADAEVDSVLAAIHLAGLAWSTAATGREPRTSTDMGAQSAVMSTQQVADELGLSDRGVRHSLAAGRLKGELVGGRWLIDRVDLAHFQAARRAA